MSNRRKTLTVTKTTQGKRWTIQVSGADPALRVLLQTALQQIAVAENAIILNGSSPFEEAKPKKGNSVATHDPLLPNLAVGQQG